MIARCLYDGGTLVILDACETVNDSTQLSLLGWFRNRLNVDSSWMTEFYGVPSTLGGIRIERNDYVPCRVPDWRVVFEEPKDMSVGPKVPEDAKWRLFPVD